MILDYQYSKNLRKFSISYVTETGGKKVLDYNVSRFKTWYLDPNGKYENWDGRRCSPKMTNNPGAYDLRTFMRELPAEIRQKLEGKFNPRLYTFDIEVEVDEKEFPEPSQAKFPVQTISVVNDQLDTIVMGLKEMEDPEGNLQRLFDEYLESSPFYRSLELKKKPVIRYIRFESERAMLEYFLENIVAKSPVIAGWNSLLFDWQYIQNRVKYYYPDIQFSKCSISKTLYRKNCQDMRGESVSLQLPLHTLVLDMMDIIGTFDLAVMPIKESLSLDYIASNSIGLHKIKYKGDLQKLYEEDYPTYVFYNAIDSVLVQLLDKKFKTLNILEAQALLIKDKVSFTFSKIAITEAAFFDLWYNDGIKIVQPDIHGRVRENLEGAYVSTPVHGIHAWTACLDFASLYPSCQAGTNISVENYIGTLGKEFTEEQINVFKQDRNYFVSVNNNVYKNDKDYILKRIQLKLKKERAFGKYLSKQLDALVMSDIEHISKGVKRKNIFYPENIVKDLNELGYNIICTDDLYKVDLIKFRNDLKNQITYYQSYEQSCKLVGNSCYGGISHIMNDFYLLACAQDTTAEGRALIHKMNKHIPEFFQKEWYNLTNLHKELDIKLNGKHPDNMVVIIYNDTDSAYISYENLVKTIEGWDKMTFRQQVDVIIGIHTKFLNEHNRKYIAEWYESRHASSIHEFELEVLGKGLWLKDTKKRYMMLLYYKDGKYYDEDDLPMKVKGLEIVKSSYPSAARDTLKKISRMLLETNDTDENHILSILNQQMQQSKQSWLQADLESICPSVSVNKYTEYVVSDNLPEGPVLKPKCPFAVRGLATYNNIRQINNLSGDPIYGGKLKYYVVQPQSIKKKRQDEMVFCFPPSEYPDWAPRYAPINRRAMFEKCVLDPFNRILEGIGFGTLSYDGFIGSFVGALF